MKIDFGVELHGIAVRLVPYMYMHAHYSFSGHLESVSWPSGYRSFTSHESILLLLHYQLQQALFPAHPCGCFQLNEQYHIPRHAAAHPKSIVYGCIVPQFVCLLPVLA